MIAGIIVSCVGLGICLNAILNVHYRAELRAAELREEHLMPKSLGRIQCRRKLGAGRKQYADAPGLVTRPSRASSFKKEAA